VKIASTIPEEREKSLVKLAKLMNTRHKDPYPISEQLLGCLDAILTSEEIDFLIEMDTDPYTYEQALYHSFMPEARFEKLFESIVRKGFAWPHETTDGVQWFRLPGFMLGAFEVYLADGAETPEKREFARRLDALFESFAKLNTFPTRNIFNAQVKRSRPQQSILLPGAAPGRTRIPVDRRLDAGPANVYPAKTVRELIEKNGDDRNIAVVHCFCRQYRKMMEEPCRFGHAPQSCLVIGSLARFAVQYGTGRYLSKSDALQLLREVESRGAVHQVFHADEDTGKPEIGICNCCWDCCGVLGSYNRGIIPLHLHAYFEASIRDAAACNGCGVCVRFCPVQAITLEDGVCRIERRMCIGCGQCELQCSQGAIRMVENERAVFLPLVKRSEARIRD